MEDGREIFDEDDGEVPTSGKVKGEACVELKVNFIPSYFKIAMRN